MAPKSKGTKINLRDLQRELQPTDALPIAPSGGPFPGAAAADRFAGVSVGPPTLEGPPLTWWALPGAGGGGPPARKQSLGLGLSPRAAGGAPQVLSVGALFTEAPLLDTQRGLLGVSLAAGAECSPKWIERFVKLLQEASLPAEEREEDRERKWNRQDREGGSGRWADRDLDGDSDIDWRRDGRPPKKEEVEVDFRGARGAKFQAAPVDEDAAFASLRRGPPSGASSAQNGGGPSSSGAPAGRRDRDDSQQQQFDFASIRSAARKAKPQQQQQQGSEELDFSSVRSGGIKRDTKQLQQEPSDEAFSNLRRGVKPTAHKVEPDRERARGLRDLVAAVVSGETPSRRESPASDAAAAASAGAADSPQPAVPPSPDAAGRSSTGSTAERRDTPPAAAAPAAAERQQQQQQQQQDVAAKKSPSETVQRTQESTSPSSSGSAVEGGAAAAAAAPAATAAAGAAEPEAAEAKKFVPRWKLSAGDEASTETAAATQARPPLREESVVLQPIKLSSLRGSGAGAASSSSSSSSGTKAANKYVAPHMRKDGAGGSGRGLSSQQQLGSSSSSSSSAVKKLLTGAPSSRDAAAAAAEAERKKQQKAEERRQQLLEKERQQREERDKVEKAFSYSDEAAMHAFVAAAQQLLQQDAAAAAAKAEECLSLLPAEDRKSLAASLCVLSLLIRAGFGVQTAEGLRTKAQPLLPLLRLLLKDSEPSASKLLIQQLVILLNELGCPRLSEEASLSEALFDFLLVERLIPHQDFVAASHWLEWLEDVDDETPGRTAVMFQHVLRAVVSRLDSLLLSGVQTPERCTYTARED
ncbi:hypothetical protein Emed_003562 [Eimeria media]